VPQVRLDEHHSLTTIPSGSLVVLMIDVEGYEPKVLMGGGRFIERIQPLIIFEYNFVSKRYFRLGNIQDILGPGYRIYRLRVDGLLDGENEKAWNCVAIPVGTEFEKFADSFIQSCTN
jgi:hypothetical protein